ncbi:MAG: ABC transporter substrate-binding protein, partial [Acidimicrobiia bacterium]
MNTRSLRTCASSISLRRSLWALVGLGMSMAAACGGQSGTESSDTVSIDYAWIPTAAIAPVHVAKEEGLFEEAGLEINFTRFDSGPAQFAALQSGDIDVADMSSMGFLAGRAQGLEAQAFGVIYDLSATNVLVARKGTGIESAGDLRGKRVAAVRNSSAYVGLIKYLNENDMSLDDVDYVQLEAPALLPAFLKGQVDAAYAWAPWYNKMIAEGGTALTDNSEVDAVGHEILVGSPEWLDQNTKSASRFLNVLHQANELMDEKGTKWVSEVVAKNQELDVETAQQIYDASTYPTMNELSDSAYEFSLTAGTADDVGLLASLEATAQDMFEFGIVEAAPELEDAVDARPAEAWREQFSAE